MFFLHQIWLASVYIVAAGALGTGQIEISPADDSVQPLEGTAYKLHCKANIHQHNQNGEYVWYHDGKAVISPDNGRIRGSTTSELLITQLTQRDKGLYQCEYDGQRSNSFQLLVKYGYETKVTQADQTTHEEGNSLVLQCQVVRQGEPISILNTIWYLKNKVLPVTRNTAGKYVSFIQDGVSQLAVNKLTKNDSGNYSCVLENGAHHGAQQSLPLFVKYSPSRPEIHVAAKTVEVGRPIKLTCLVQDLGYPVSHTYIFKDGEGEDLLDSRSNRFEITQLTATSKEIMCSVRSDILISDVSESITLTWEAPVQIEKVEVNKSVMHGYSEIICLASGSHIKRLFWSKNGTTVQENDQLKILQTVAMGQYSYGQKSALQSTLSIDVRSLPFSCDSYEKYNGDYICSVEGNVVNMTTKSSSKPTTFGVAYSPMWNPSHVNYNLVDIGMKNIEIRCAVCGFPHPTDITWHFSKGDIPDTDIRGGIIHINKVSSHHFGNYTCSVLDNLQSEKQKKKIYRYFGITLIGKPKSTRTGADASFWILLVTSFMVLCLLFGVSKTRNWFSRQSRSRRRKVAVYEEDSLPLIETDEGAGLSMKGVGRGLAWSYFEGFLKYILPELSSKIESSIEQWNSDPSKVCFKFLIFVPNDCQCPSGFTDEDERFFEPDNNVIEIASTRDGHRARSFKMFVQGIRDIANNTSYYFVGEFPTSLGTLRSMEEGRLASMSKEDRLSELSTFCNTLYNFINHPNTRNIHNTIHVQGYEKTTDSLGDLALDIIKKNTFPKRHAT